MIDLFAAIAGALAVVGIYGVLAYAVGQRSQEIGVRMVGAQHGDVLRLVLRQGVVLAAGGITAGVAGAAGLGRYLSGMLFGLTPLDATTCVAVVAVFGIVTGLASYPPARRATKIDPMTGAEM